MTAEPRDRTDRPNADAVPDAADAPRAEDLLPDEPPDEAPVTGDPNKKTAVESPIPSHGMSASSEQLAEGERAEDLADE